MSEPQSSGADLARVALLAARKAAKNEPAPNSHKPRRSSRRRRDDGRDPMPFGKALERLMDEHGWETPAAGGSILDQWATLCPDLVGKVAPEGFAPETGELRLRPGSHAYVTQLTWFRGQLIKRINEKLGKPVVRSIRILSVGPITSSEEPAAADIEDREETPGPVRTRETASPGYRHTLAVHQSLKPERPGEHPLVTAARASLDAAIAHPSRREPEHAFTDAVAETERVALPDQRDAGEAVRQAAIRMARDQKAGGRGLSVRRLFDTA